MAFHFSTLLKEKTGKNPPYLKLVASATEEIVNLTLLQEALDNEKTPALILTVSLFHRGEKRRKKKAAVSQYALTLHDCFIAASVFLAANINCHTGNNTFQLKCGSNQL